MGTFTQGGSPTVEGPAHLSTVSGFALDKYEVTVGRFRNFLVAYSVGWRPQVGNGMNVNVMGIDTSWQAGWNDSSGPAANLPTPAAFTDASHLKCNSGYQTWTDTQGSNEKKPINCVNWFEAFAFCIWDAGRLPTESEWEDAAAGASENRKYPWGNTPEPDCFHANYYTGSSYCGPSGVAALANVGAYASGQGKWGHLDMAGNVEEWAFDWYANYTSAATTNYANATPGTDRITRGGNFPNTSLLLLSAYRNTQAPTSRSYTAGFRCARSAQ